MPAKSFTAEDGGNYCAIDGVLYSADKKTLCAYPVLSEEPAYAVPEGTEKIADYAFSDAKRLETVTFPGTLTEIGGGALQRSSVTRLELQSAQECTLGGYWADDCEKLEEIDFGTGIRTARIPFYHVPNLREVRIGTDVSEILVSDSDGLQNMPPSLETIDVDEENTYFKSTGGILYSKDGARLLKIPESSKIQVYEMPDTVTEVAEYAAEGNENLTDLVCGSKLKKIGSHGFENCSSIKTISLNAVLRTIGEDAFGALDYSKAEIPRAVSTIGRNAFLDCTIYGYTGTEAESYAADHQLKFVSLDVTGSQSRPQPSGEETSVWDGETASEIIPDGASPDRYVVNTAAELKWIAEEVDRGNLFKEKTVVLNADIDLQEFVWEPIGTGEHPFQGSFDGQNHIISNMVLDTEHYERTGLFGNISVVKSTESFFKDVILLNVKATGVGTGGALAGQVSVKNNSSVTISNISSDGVFSGYTMGGIAGYIQNDAKNARVVIRDCHAVMDMTGAGQRNAFDTGGGKMGGIAGMVRTGTEKNYGTVKSSVRIKDCTFSGTMTGKGRYCQAGGMVCYITAGNGKGETVLEGCTANGSSYPGRSTSSGGILGSGTGRDNSEVFIKSCVNKMSVNGGYYAGGIVGHAGSDIRIKECCNEGYVVSNETGGVFGGICGEFGGGAIIEDSVNTGRIGGTNFGYSGGICGMQLGVIRRCYNLGGTPQTIHSSTAVSAPGAFAAMRRGEGKTEYSYFSLDRLPVQYLYGEEFVTNPAQEIDRGVRSTMDGSILSSGGISNDDFKKKQSLLTWDFDSVWTYDKAFSKDFPVPLSIRNLVTKYEGSKKSGSTGTSGKNDNFYLTVVDKEGEPVEGAEVRFGTDSLSTNDSGTVQYQRDRLPAGLSVSAYGFIEYTVEEFRIPAEMNDFKVYLKREEDTGKYDLKSALLLYNNEYTELLAGTKQINIFKKDTPMTITCVPAYEETKISKYAIYQGTKEIAASTDGTFSLKNSDFTVQNHSEDQVYALTYDEAGNVASKTLLNLDVILAESIDLEGISIGRMLTHKVKDSYPVFNGELLSFRDAVLPVSVVITEDSWKVGVNLNKSVLESHAERDVNFLKLLLNKKQEFKTESELFDSKKVIPEIKLGDNPEIKLSLMGYGEGKLPYDNTININVTGSISVSYKKQKQVDTFVVGIDIQGKMNADGTVTLTMGQKNKSARLNRAALNLGADVLPYGGVGIAGASMAGFYGDGKLNLSYLLSPESVAGPERLYGTGELGIIVHWGQESYKIPILDGQKDLYNRDTDTEAARSARKAAAQAEENAAGQVQVTGDTSVGLRPYVMQVGTDKVMVYENKDSSRKEADQEAVMYSVYDEKGKSWGAPSVIADDGTADMNPQIRSDGTNGYVIWSNASGSFEGYDSVGEKAAKTDLCIARYDTESHTFSNVQTIEQNDYYEQGAVLRIKDGNPAVIWTKSSGGNVWQAAGDSRIYMAEPVEGEWKTQELMQQAEPSDMDAAGSLAGEDYYAYIDKNGKLVLCNTGTGESTAVSETGASSVRFLTVKGKEALLWTNEEGDVYLTVDPSKEAEQIMDHFSGEISSIISDGNDNLALLYTRQGNNCANGYVRYYDSGTDTWSEEMEILTGGKYIDQISGTYENGTLRISYNERTITSDGETVRESNKLRHTEVKSKEADLSIGDVTYNPYDVQEKEALPVRFTVRNTGSGLCSNLKLAVNDGTSDVLEKKLDFTLAGGEEREAEAELLLPEKMSKKTYTFTVTDEDKDCSSMKNNSAKTEIGYARLEIDGQLYRIEGNYSTVATVRNTGYDTASGYLMIYNAKNEAQIYEKYQFAELAPGEAISFSTGLQGKMSSDGDQRIGMKVVSDEEILIPGETTTLMARQDESIPVSEVKLEESFIELENAGDTVSLHAAVLPADASDQQLLYTSSDPYIASVSEEGVVTGVRTGTARIRVSSADGKCYQTCVVKVGKVITVDRVELSDVELKMKPGESRIITANVFPAEADQEVAWKSSDQSVAEVSESGEVSAHHSGTAVITANASGQTAQCTVTVESDGEEPGGGDEPGGGEEPGGGDEPGDDNITGRAEKVEKVSQLTTGGSYGPDMDKVWKYEWSGTKSIDITFSEQTSLEDEYDFIYIYDKNGECTGIYTGKELAGKTVTVPGDTIYIRLVSDGSNEEYGFDVVKLTSDSGKVLTAESDTGGGNQTGSGNNKGTGTTVPRPVKVSRISIRGISKKIAAGKKVQLSASITPSNAANKGIIWTSSNKKVAKVDSRGRVSLLKKSGGKSVVITAAARDGSKVKATYKIKSMKGVVKSVSISGKKLVKAGKKLKLKGSVKATKGANKKLQWKSSNNKYAVVNSAGKVTAKKAGKGKRVKITAMATDGSGKKKTVVIKIR